MRLIIIRHGDPDYEKDSLTSKGVREAMALQKRVATWDVDAFYTSPLGRAKKTAQLAMEGIEKECTTLFWLEEFRVRAYDPVAKRIKRPWDFYPSWWTKDERFYQLDEWTKAKGMNEEVATVFEETCDGLDGLLKQYGYVRRGKYYHHEREDNPTIVLFCHMGITGAMLSHLIGIPMPVLMQGMYLAPTSVSILNTEERQKGIAYFRAQVLGDTRHLWEAKEDISSSGYFGEVFQK